MPENSIQLFIAFYTDEDVHQQLAQKIREHGFDAVSAREIGHQHKRLTSQALAFCISCTTPSAGVFNTTHDWRKFLWS